MLRQCIKSIRSKYPFKCFNKRDLRLYFRNNITKNLGQFKKLIGFFIFLCIYWNFFVGYKLDFSNRFDFIDDKNKTSFDEIYNTSQKYVVDNPGCRIPHFEVMDKDIEQFMSQPETYSCRKPLITASDHVVGQLNLNMEPNELLRYYHITNINTITCNYMEIRRKTDNSNLILPPVFFKLDKVIRLPANLEFIKVKCYNAEKYRIYLDYYFFAVDKNETNIMPPPRKINDPINQTEPQTKTEQVQDEGLSVMILGIDSVSHLNFLRYMPKTSDYIKKHLSHVEFWGFNKVGDNTFPNLVPLLSGFSQEELYHLYVSGSNPIFDRCPFIWKAFKVAGYKTAFAEDVAELALFNNFRKGFQHSPTDYYIRPVMIEMEITKASKVDGNVKLCMGGRRTADVLLEYIRKLIPKFQKDNFFSFFWTVTLTHDYLNGPLLLDNEMTNLFDKLKESGVLNKTLVLLMSDHGMRYGVFRSTYQGMIEERQPLLMALYPEWLAKKYPEAVANLQLNSKRLTTHFDLHATMLQLLDMRSLEKEQLQNSAAELKDPDKTLPRGISLFLPVPVERTCEQANIADHWCTCHQRQEIQVDDIRVQRAARYVVRQINDQLKSMYECSILYLNSILQAFIVAPHYKILKELENDYAVDITLRLQTIPGLADFESTVRMSEYKTTLSGTISRINLYSNQSNCIENSSLKMFCYCHQD